MYNMQREVRSDVALLLIFILSVVVGYAAIITDGYMERVANNLVNTSLQQADFNAELREKKKAGSTSPSEFDKRRPLPYTGR